MAWPARASKRRPRRTGLRSLVVPAARRARPARLPGCASRSRPRALPPAIFPGCVCVAVLPLARWVESWARWAGRREPRGLYYVDARCRLGFWLSAVARSPGLNLLRPTGEREIRGLIDLIRIQEGEVWKQGFELRAEQASVACISWMMRVQSKNRATPWRFRRKFSTKA